jgi:hypothetical protein
MGLFIKLYHVTPLADLALMGRQLSCYDLTSPLCSDHTYLALKKKLDDYELLRDYIDLPKLRKNRALRQGNDSDVCYRVSERYGEGLTIDAALKMAKDLESGTHVWFMRERQKGRLMTALGDQPTPVAQLEVEVDAERVHLPVEARGDVDWPKRIIPIELKLEFTLRKVYHQYEEDSDHLARLIYNRFPRCTIERQSHKKMYRPQKVGGHDGK